MDVSQKSESTCSTYNGKCGGDKWRGSEECCDEFATCFIKDGTYSQCRTDCPAGWDCETLPPTKLPTPKPSKAPTLSPSSSLPVRVVCDCARACVCCGVLRIAHVLCAVRAGVACPLCGRVCPCVIFLSSELASSSHGGL